MHVTQPGKTLEEAGYRQKDSQGILATKVPLGNDRLHIVRSWVGVNRKGQQGGGLGVLASEQGCERWCEESEASNRDWGHHGLGMAGKGGQ